MWLEERLNCSGGLTNQLVLNSFSHVLAMHLLAISSGTGFKRHIFLQMQAADMHCNDLLTH
jgi:hypothetical protein